MLNCVQKSGDKLTLKVKSRLNSAIEKEFNKYSLSVHDNYVEYSFDQYPNISFTLKYLLKRFKSLSATDEALESINDSSSMAVSPKIYLYSTEAHVAIQCPPISHYMEIVATVGGYEKGLGVYTVPIARAFDVIRAVGAKKSFLPDFEIDDSITHALVKPIEEYDGTIAGLFSTPIDDIYAVKNAYGIGVSNFEAAGYKTLSDLLLQKPTRYIDKTQISDFRDLEIKEPVTFIGTITDKKLVAYKHTSISLKVGQTIFKVTYYNRGWMYDKFNLGDEVLIMGEYRGKKEISGQSCDSLLEAKALNIVPIYPQSPKNKITTRNVMNSIYELIERLAPQSKNLAYYIKSDKIAMSLGKAVKELHFPSSSYKYIEALETLAFYELVYLQLMIANRRATEIKSQGLPKPQKRNGYLEAMLSSLPWTLTDAQKKGMKEFNKYLGSNMAEEVLLSAEVGSGKTVLAQLACMQSLDNGYQSVLAGPTEVLARQLYDGFVESIERMPAGLRPTVAYLGGGIKAAEKRDILRHVKSGAIDVLIGTHSVLNSSIEYNNLGLVVIDEQQKFGRAQRESLLMSRTDGLKPDLIAQTATPIPRSTAQAFYGDIDIIQLEGKPPGRKEVVTEWIRTNPKDITKDAENPMWADIKNEVSKGHQVFIVVPMVYDSKSLNASSVEGTYKDLKKILPGININYMHGQLKKEKQNEVMERFRNNEDQILIGSTVIEVGVNIVNATRIIILSADRIGASSLHQIRGRVGQSNLDSKCYLVSEGKTKTSEKRLQALVDSTDGFEIAKIDLETRGEGDLFGIRQAGESSLMFATLVDHSKLISEAKEIAHSIYESEYKDEALADAIAVVKKEGVDL